MRTYKRTRWERKKSTKEERRQQQKQREIDKENVKLFLKSKNINTYNINGSSFDNLKRNDVNKFLLKNFNINYSEASKKLNEPNFLKLDEKENSFIYFIGNVTEGYLKIGFSNTPEERLRAIQTGCPFKINLYYKHEAPISVETLLHKRYKNLNSYGEWFHFEGQLKEDFVSFKKDKNYLDDIINKYKSPSYNYFMR